MSNNWKSKNRHKSLLQYHLIFVCKYRKKLLASKSTSDDIKQFSYDICQKHNVKIHKMETDKDHIHYMIETEPNINLSNLVRTIKSYTTYHIWKLYGKYLSRHFGRENIFWTDGYFICSIGNVSEKQLRKYIENQG
ncbi:MAG: IS200/IS605 family transposase [Faecalimonas umbilicata]|jgi:putative transposase|uniref:IS200/IS605 family transposase n=1 Tax=Faecalimonas umbilicata TaxID=1912855 RepID=UPI003991D884